MSEIAAATVRITLYNLQCPDNFSEEFPDPEDLVFGDGDDIESDSFVSCLSVLLKLVRFH